MHAWVSDEEAVYPYDAVYAEDETDEQNQAEGAAEMMSSQDAAIAVALDELGYDVTEPVVAAVSDGAPADGVLEVGDEILEVNGKKVDQHSNDVVDGGRRRPPASRCEFVVRRDGKRQQVPSGDPEDQADGEPQVGIQLGRRRYDFPFDVTSTSTRQHRRAERRPDVLARPSTTPSPRAR